MKVGRIDCYLGPPGVGIKQVFKTRTFHDCSEWLRGCSIFYTHTARTAISKACTLMGIDRNAKVLAPSYNCGAEVDALLHSGANVELYRIRQSGTIDIDDILSRCGCEIKAIYITHYFGFPQETKRIEEICAEKGAYLIEDCALTMLSLAKGQIIGSVGDISILNFPKTFPVPDGGALRINNRSLLIDRWKRRRSDLASVFRVLLSLWKSRVLSIAGNSIILLNLVWRLLRKKPIKTVTEGKIGKHREMPREYYYSERLSDRSMSYISKRLLSTYDINLVRAARQRNYAEYLRLLDREDWARPFFSDLPEDVCPLSFPVVIHNRDKICKILNDWSINAIPWWAGYHAGFNWDLYPDACYLKDNILSLPVDQSLGSDQIEYIVQKLVEAKEYHDCH